jgi:hypothetical protein
MGTPRMNAAAVVVSGLVHVSVGRTREIAFSVQFNTMFRA